MNLVSGSGRAEEMIKYQTTRNINEQQLLKLYSSVGWSNYTSNPQTLTLAVRNSLVVHTAWANEELVGLIRGVGDGVTILYIQDLLVAPSFQGKGIGQQLVKRILNQFPKVRQKVLMTVDERKTRQFYERCGFLSCDKGELVAFSYPEV